MLKNYLIGFVTGSTALFWLLACFAGLAVERLRPVERRQPSAAVVLNLGYAVFHAWARYGLGPLAAAASVIAVGALGGGLLALPAAGIGLLWAVPLYLLATDFAEYLFHRAQHAWAPLWAMHSLHHSETALNVTTTLRHFWIESALKAVFLFPLVAVLLKPSPAVLGVYVLAANWNFVAHMNLRLGFGPLWPMLTSPHYHRLHHAADAAYLNRNFAGIFPVFDLLFGTHRPPRANEYPAVGLPGGEAPKSLVETILWPLRRRLLPVSAHYAPAEPPARLPG